jgi:uncharacterized protein YbaR (Trm112 family)
MSGDRPPRPVPPEVLAIVRCPSCRGPLEVVDGALICRVERWRYPVVDGVPWLTPEDRAPLPPG